MLLAGLTGGLASGKTFIASQMRAWGCVVVAADELGHAALAPGGEAHDEVLKQFGTVDRPALASLVFSDPEALARLNAIVHPAVRRLLKAEINRQDPRTFVVYEAAILIESGGYRDCDKLILAACPREQQIARALARPGATEAGVLARLARQMPLESKVKYADYIIDTSGTKEDTIGQTKMVVEELRRLAS